MPHLFRDGGSGAVTLRVFTTRQPRFRTCGRRGFECARSARRRRRPRERRVEHRHATTTASSGQGDAAGRATYLVEKPMTDSRGAGGGDRHWLGRRIAVLQAGQWAFNPVFHISANGRYGTALHRDTPAVSVSGPEHGPSGWCWIDDSRSGRVWGGVCEVTGRRCRCGGHTVSEQVRGHANARLRFEERLRGQRDGGRCSVRSGCGRSGCLASGPAPSFISLDYREQEGFIYRIARMGRRRVSLLKKLLGIEGFGHCERICPASAIVREPVPITKEEPLKAGAAAFW